MPMLCIVYCTASSKIIYTYTEWLIIVESMDLHVNIHRGVFFRPQIWIVQSVKKNSHNSLIKRLKKE